MDAAEATNKDVAKGERFNLTKGNAGDHNFYVGLGWNAGDSHDLDASVFALDGNGKLVSDKHFVYFSNLKSPDGAIVHSGDNLTGEGDGDDEQIRFYLDKLDPRVEELSIVVCIYQANTKHQNFGQVSKAYVQVASMDAAGNPPTVSDGRGGLKVDPLTRFPLSDDYGKFTAIQVGSIYKRDDGEWGFNPTGVGFEGAEIGDILKHYTV